MQIDSKAYGRIDIQEYQIISFPEGIFGFPDRRRYALLENEEDSPFQWLQSLDDANLAFITIQPDLFLANYNPICSEEDLRKIGLHDISKALILTIVTVPENPAEMTANLQGPLLINKDNRQAIQGISIDDKHVVKYRIVKQEG